MYLKEYKLQNKYKGRQICKSKNNILLINNLNYMHRYVFHQGSLFIKKQFYPYCIRSVAYCFLKFTKPFFFRSKKKK